MGCAGSKRMEAAVAADDIYRPPPTSIALFDINTVEEPWLITTTTTATGDDQPEQDKKPTATTHVPLPILEKLDSFDVAPQPWSEVSKALEDLKPTLHLKPIPPTQQPPPPPKAQAGKPPASLPGDHSPPRPAPLELSGLRPVRENSFVLRDRQEREKGGNATSTVRWKRRDPLEGYPELPPPGNAQGMVLYTTTLRGVRRTFEDCERARLVAEGHAAEAGVEVDERDVSLHGEFLRELRELLGEGAAVPRLFIRGRYIGGVEEMVELDDAGKLREMMKWVKGGKGARRGCEGCGGARFVPCLECNGSCKVVAEDGKEVVRCGVCNENGLVMCPLCLQ